MQAVTIRQADQRDRAGVARLAALDSTPPPEGRVLLAFVDGDLRAALDLETCSELADPFHHTRKLTELLRMRAAQAYAREVAEERSGIGLRRGLHTLGVLIGRARARGAVV